MSERVKNWPKGPWKIVNYNYGLVVSTESDSKTKYGAVRYAAIGGFNREDAGQMAEAKGMADLIKSAPALVEAAEGLIKSVMERYDLKSVDELTCPHMQELAKAVSMAYGETQ